MVKETALTSYYQPQLSAERKKASVISQRAVQAFQRNAQKMRLCLPHKFAEQLPILVMLLNSAMGIARSVPQMHLSSLEHNVDLTRKMNVTSQ